jgi:6-phosphogluconolactonase (cycloisomerase 2 family)
MGFKTRAAACLGLAFGVLAVAAGPAAAAGRHQVYTSTNAAAGNAVLAFERAGDGSLRPAGSFATGASGTGNGLGNQGAIASSRGGRFLYVVNAGSDTVSTFAVHPRRLELLGSTASRGEEPISLTTHGNLLYVLNAASGTVAGFTGARDGSLAPLSGSKRPIAGSGPAEVRFSPDGKVLVVTNKDTNTIDTFAIGPNGRPGPAQSHPSVGETPFGFDFDKRGHLIVSEAFGGAAGASALSSYAVGPGGALGVISPSVADHEAAACWIAISPNSRFAYTTNTGSGSISSYSIGDDGSLQLLEQVAASTGVASAPTDLAESRGGRVLIALLPGTDSVASYRVRAGGRLQLVDQVGGVPATATGLAAG